MAVVLELLLELWMFFQNDRRIAEEDIEKNIRYLRQQSWFHNYLDNPLFRKIIIYDTEVRQLIGKQKYKKLHRPLYTERFHKKFAAMMHEKVKS
ncbi:MULTISPECIES: hypothetical protein [Clostridia]|uniref:hypothetical protein n=1 Tax=Clostridia TaxID=186801 RepID=UPI000EA33BEB|nr:MULTISPECIES: hypothetical protein [Clostridia]NBJ70992.1 hypothetical protein [Roseburia sp. 1XD42-34]RKI75429.1 hypothetical protein D7V87_16245 [Clostridium sp. 1xD42-85]